MRFVLTGRAYIGDQFVERGNVIETIHVKGHIVTDRVHSRMDVLVSSRSDTVKAREAARMGCTVISYDELWRLLDGEPLVREKPVPVDEPWVDEEKPATAFGQHQRAMIL